MLFQHLDYKQGIVKLIGSFSLVGSLFWSIAKHSSLSSTIDKSSNFLLFVKSSFKNFAYVGIYDIASTKGKLICSCLKSLRNLPNCASIRLSSTLQDMGLVVYIPSAPVFHCFRILPPHLLFCQLLMAASFQIQLTLSQSLL